MLKPKDLVQNKINERNTFFILYRTIESGSMMDIESITFPQIDNFEQTKSNNAVYQMSTSVTSEAEEIQREEKENCKERFCSVIVTPKVSY